MSSSGGLPTVERGGSFFRHSGDASFLTGLDDVIGFRGVSVMYMKGVNACI